MAAPRNPVQVRVSLEQRLKNVAEQTGEPLDAVRRRFVLMRFLDRLFSADREGWILKGGTGMMVRLPNARHSKDIDLVTRHDSDAVQTLIAIVTNNRSDPFRYDISPRREIAGTDGTTLTVTARLGTSEFTKFTIDLVNEHSLVGRVEDHPLRIIVEDKNGDFPSNASSIRLYPLADQVADKLCAMYEQYGTSQIPSSRTRDLVDLLLISGHLELQLVDVVQAAISETGRRDMTLPPKMAAPAETWRDLWTREQATARLPRELHELDGALLAAGQCYNQVLGSIGSASTCPGMIWIPGKNEWVDVH